MKLQVNLDAMLKDLRVAPRIYHPSKFWIHLNEEHTKILSNLGFKNFKRSVNLRYFNWGILGIIAHGMSPLIDCLLKNNYSPFISGKFENYNSLESLSVRHFNKLTAYLYKTYVCALFDYVSLSDKYGVLDKLSEPTFGNPFIIKYKGQIISQDLCNSAHEFNCITNSADAGRIRNVVELGAGYGRTAYVFLKTLPQINYTIIDIPPALCIAQGYLSKVFSKEKFFYYRRFKSFSQVKKDFETARIKFLMTDQIELLPKKYFDLSINISSLHEMRRNQIKNYLVQIDKVCKGFFYTKQWYRSFTADNSHIKQQEYPIPNNWKLVYSRYPHPIQRWFFDALYKIN